MENVGENPWFGSKYYHILYSDRNIFEAEKFIHALKTKLDFRENKKILDAACGKGRYSKILHSLGMEVEGFDLSESNILEAKKMEVPKLNFFVHDIRKPLTPTKLGTFDFIGNFFTSFGYFDNFEDNQMTFYSFHQALKKGGIFIMDYFNPTYVLANLIKQETIFKGGIKFQIKRWDKAGFLYKSIEFTDEGKDYHFEEKVELISKNDFIQYANLADFRTIDLFGNYHLENFDDKHSPRMIFLWVKE